MAGWAEPAFAGVVTSVPRPMRAGRPRSRVGLARILIAANRLRARATPWQGAPDPLWQVSSPLCHVVCGRDARAPGWVSPASLLLRTGCEPGPLLGRVHRTCFCRCRHLCATSYAGGTPALPGGSRPRPYCCELAASQGHSFAGRAEPTLAGFVTSVPRPMRARRPRSRVGLARILIAANWLRARATPWQGAPNLLLQVSSPLCHVLCGRDARAPGWVSPASLLLRTGCEPGPLLCRVGRTYPCRVRHLCAKSYAGGTPALPGGSRTRPYWCEQAASQGHSLAGCAEPTFAGVDTSVPSPMRARRPRSRVGLARVLIAANWLRARATPWQGAPNPLWQVSSPLCQVLCGRDARAPGWVSPASLLVRTGCEPGPLPGRVRRTCFCRCRHLCAKSYAGETPAFPGGSRPRPYWCKQAASQGHSLAGCAEPTLAGFVTIVPSRMRARRPRSRVGLARVLIGANRLRARATPWQGGPNLPLQGSSQSCQVLCGRDARAPGWVLSRLFFNAPPHPKFPRRWRHRCGDSGPGGGSACRGLPGIEARL